MSSPDRPYRLRLRLLVAHAYYASGNARGLRLQPDADTAIWLRSRDAVCRDTGDGLELHAAQSPLAEREEPPVLLRWTARCDDPLFARVTLGLAPGPEQVPMLRCGLAEAPAGGETRLLHAEPTVAARDAWPTHVPGVLAAWLSPRERQLPPAFVVELPAPDLRVDAKQPQMYRIAFAARAAVWKYVLLGNWAPAAVRVEDAAGRVRFTAPTPGRLRNGQSALVCHSSDPIELRERASEQFQLRSRTAVADRVLVQRLPVAGADQFAREAVDDTSTLVSEIYVHR